MWEFLTSLLDQHGLLGFIVLVTYAALGYAIFLVWKRGNTAQDALAAEHKASSEQQKAAGVTLSTYQRQCLDREHAVLTAEHNKRSEMRDAHEKELASLRGQLAGEARHFAERIDLLQEKRNDEMKDMLRESITNVAATRSSVEKITEAMQTLRDIMKR